ncbi:hypothetical protein GCM10010174_36480 [Kutzneria viridogrisea]|uniref:Uncharacterized protein n=2 Tax=Kutzneria TaxID=43356 RepID=W5W0V1_9PSEU|nr:hypothetical protein [Kutzneria albida]AHH94798.1 hypothetical protein KALB_1425 [Kutzneria albida DSM 43870]
MPALVSLPETAAQRDRLALNSINRTALVRGMCNAWPMSTPTNAPLADTPLFEQLLEELGLAAEFAEIPADVSTLLDPE